MAGIAFVGSPIGFGFAVGGEPPDTDAELIAPYSDAGDARLRPEPDLLGSRRRWR